MTECTFHPAHDSFPDHQEAWQALNLKGPNSPLLEPSFLLPLLKEFGTGHEILCVYGGATPSAMALLSPKGKGVWETFQPSQAPLGPWLEDKGVDTRQVLKALFETLPGFPLVLGITQQDPDIYSRPAADGLLGTVDYIDTARISIRGSFEDYWSGRGKNLRHNMKKQRAQLDREGIVTRLEVLSDPDEVSAGVADYGRLESAGWKSEGETAVHPDNAQGRFYRSMLENFCRLRRGRIYRYWFNDRIAAMDLCIEGNGALIILKTTYDEQVANGTSPAFLMRQEIFSGLFDDPQSGINRIEFYGKVMDWHKRWSEEIRTLYHVNGYRWPVVPWLHSLKKRAMALRPGK